MQQPPLAMCRTPRRLARCKAKPSSHLGYSLFCSVNKSAMLIDAVPITSTLHSSSFVPRNSLIHLSELPIFRELPKKWQLVTELGEISLANTFFAPRFAYEHWLHCKRDTRTILYLVTFRLLWNYVNSKKTNFQEYSFNYRDIYPDWTVDHLHAVENTNEAYCILQAPASCFTGIILCWFVFFFNRPFDDCRET